MRELAAIRPMVIALVLDKHTELWPGKVWRRRPALPCHREPDDRSREPRPQDRQSQKRFWARTHSLFARTPCRAEFSQPWRATSRPFEPCKVSLPLRGVSLEHVDDSTHATIASLMNLRPPAFAKRSRCKSHEIDRGNEVRWSELRGKCQQEERLHEHLCGLNSPRRNHKLTFTDVPVVEAHAVTDNAAPARRAMWRGHREVDRFALMPSGQWHTEQCCARCVTKGCGRPLPQKRSVRAALEGLEASPGDGHTTVGMLDVG